MLIARESRAQNLKKDRLDKKVEQYKTLVKKLMTDHDLNELEDNDEFSALQEAKDQEEKDTDFRALM